MKQRLFFSLGFLGKIALATILPLVVFMVAGRLTDKTIQTSPYFTITGAVFALFTTYLWLRYLSKKYVKKINELY